MGGQHAELDRWLLSLRDRGLAQRTIHYTKTILSTALSYAVYPCKLIRENPCRYLKTPKTDGGHHVERVIVTPEKLQELLEAFPPGTSLYLPILLLYHTGMRLGEALGLAWGDIDFQEKSLSVCKQRVLDAIGHDEYLSDPKTKTGRRKIFIPDYLVELLKMEKARQEAAEASLEKSTSSAVLMMAASSTSLPRGCIRKARAVISSA
ncbi:site-specific integrase [Selenomonas sp.]|uniref:site-specific integrase n=1 Tax=Selenomonas sp. TaxID=2053611 RepID=UPI002A760631|nr:tyrosine-type recombinase/integrase [Selenomonas sp.]MDY3298634.1 tyrosine-type recombinase/integrase [Selenomonas sp.]